MNALPQERKDFRELFEIAKGFRSGMLESKPSSAMCFAICAPLEGYLSFCGYDCRLVKGDVGDWEHFWIALSDGRIIDPTADQFSNPEGIKMPQIYIGPKPSWYGEGSPA